MKIVYHNHNTVYNEKCTILTVDIPLIDGEIQTFIKCLFYSLTTITMHTLLPLRKIHWWHVSSGLD